MSEPVTTLPVAGRDVVVAKVTALIRRFRGRLAGIVLVHAAAVGCALMPPLLLGDLVDRLAAGQPAELGRAVLLIVTALVAGAVLAYTAAAWSFALGERVFALLRTEFFEALLALPVRRVETVEPGEVLSRSTSDMDAIHEVTRTGVPEILVGSVTTLLTLGFAFVVNPLVAVAALVGIPFIVVSTRWYVRHAPQAYGDELAARADVSTAATETVRGHDVVGSLDLGAQRERVIRTAVARSLALAGVPIRLEQRWFPAVQAGYHLPLVAVLGWGAWLVSQGRAEIGEVAAIALYLRAILTPLDDLIYWFGEAQPAGAALARILGAEAEARGSDDRPGGTGEGVVRLERAGYAYTAGVEVLHDVDLDLRPGERLCVVGASGAGKTTLALLLAGVLTPTSGRVVPGADRPVLVAQEDHVFHGTVRDNLTLAGPGSSDEQLWEALRAAGADGWVGGLDTALDASLGDDGYPPTPAQSRQLSLARLFLGRPRVLILDEATAGLSDAEVERIEEALPVALAGTTVVQIAHDLAAAVRSDRVVLLEHGRITASGTHAELLAAGGGYAQLWQAWRAAAV